MRAPPAPRTHPTRAHVSLSPLLQAESLYLHSIYSEGGCRGPHYTPIFASGANAATLHYGHVGAPNDRCMEGGELLLADAGAEYYR